MQLLEASTGGPLSTRKFVLHDEFVYRSTLNKCTVDDLIIEHL